MENLVPIPMRDGVILYADVYRPLKEGKYPVLVSRTPYSTERYPAAYDSAVFFARRGYVFVYQDCASCGGQAILLPVPITRPSSTLQARHAACTHGYAVHPMFDL